MFLPSSYPGITAGAGVHIFYFLFFNILSNHINMNRNSSKLMAGVKY